MSICNKFCNFVLPLWCGKSYDRVLAPSMGAHDGNVPSPKQPVYRSQHTDGRNSQWCTFQAAKNGTEHKVTQVFTGTILMAVFRWSLVSFGKWVQALGFLDPACLLTLAFVASGTMLGSLLEQDAELQRRQLPPSADRHPP